MGEGTTSTNNKKDKLSERQDEQVIISKPDHPGVD
jgi:hypothetical protein